MALFILEVKCCGTAFIFGSAGEGWDGPTTPEHLRAPSIYLSIYISPREFAIVPRYPSGSLAGGEGGW